jgi:hypothetical protein
VSDVLKSVDQSELLNLQREQDNVIDLIKQNDSSQGQMIQRLAKIIERRIELGDPECSYPVNQISTIITRLLDNPNVPRHLSDKYKDSRLSGYAKLAIHLQHLIIDGGIQLDSQRIEESSNQQLEQYYEQLDETDNELDTTISQVRKNKERCEQVAKERGLQLAGFKFRKAISAHDDHYQTPETLEGLIDATCKSIHRIGLTFFDIEARYKEWPADNFEDAKRDYLSNLTFEQILRPEKDLKWSGSWSFWFNRGYLETTEGKHAAGNSDKFPTLLCTWCSRDMKDNPEDYHLMQKDPESPTGWRCLKCNGMSFRERETTREQVGDRKDEVFTFANTVIQSFPYFADFLSRHHNNYWKKIIDGRKARIAPQFSNSAIAGTDTKVIKSKAK